MEGWKEEVRGMKATKRRRRLRSQIRGTKRREEKIIKG